MLGATGFLIAGISAERHRAERFALEETGRALEASLRWSNAASQTHAPIVRFLLAINWLGGDLANPRRWCGHRLQATAPPAGVPIRSTPEGGDGVHLADEQPPL